MLPTEAAVVNLLAAIIDLLTAVVVAAHVVWALWTVLRGQGPERAKGIVADGVIAALGFGVAGSLLKTIALEDWPHIRVFAFVLAFRTLLKRVFQREARTVARSG